MQKSNQKYTNKELNAVCRVLREIITENSAPDNLLQPACFVVQKMMLLEEELFTELETRLKARS